MQLWRSYGNIGEWILKPSTEGLGFDNMDANIQRALRARLFNNARLHSAAAAWCPGQVARQVGLDLAETFSAQFVPLVLAPWPLLSRDH